MFNRWSPIHQWVVALPLAMVLGSFLADQMAGLIAPADLVGVVSPVSQLVAGLMVYMVGARMLESRWPSQLRIRGLSELFGGLLLGGLACLGIVVVLLSQGLVQVTLADGGIGVLYNVLRIGLVAGVLEEVIFRGIILRRLEPVLGVRNAVGVVALAFAAIHVFSSSPSFFGLIGAFVGGGVFLSLLFLHTRSIWLVIGFHLAWNTVQGPVFGSPVSGSPTGTTWLHWRGNQSWLLNGGAFGLEASLITIFGFLAASLILWRMIGRKGLNEFLLESEEVFVPVRGRTVQDCPTIFESLMGDPDQYQEEILNSEPEKQSVEEVAEFDADQGDEELGSREPEPTCSEDESFRSDKSAGQTGLVDHRVESVEDGTSTTEGNEQPVLESDPDIETTDSSRAADETSAPDGEADPGPEKEDSCRTGPEPVRKPTLEAFTHDAARNEQIIRVGKKSGRPYLRILGAVELEGSRRAGKRRNRYEMELLAYLVLHPEAGGSEIDKALWPKKVAAKQSTPRIPVAAAVRSMLGSAADGSSRLMQRTYALHDLDSDWQEFQELTGETAVQDQLRAALTLVRGEPLAGISGRWVEPWRKQILKTIEAVTKRVDSFPETDSTG